MGNFRASLVLRGWGKTMLMGLLRPGRVMAIVGLAAAGLAGGVAPAAIADGTTLPVAGPAGAPYAADEVLVRYDGEAPASVPVPAGHSVASTLQRLNGDPAVATALPDYVATGAGFTPNDPGQAGVIGGWQQDQWNFLDSAAGIGASSAWSNVGAAAGGRGVTIAVIDSGVAYRSKGRRFARDPDLARTTFAAGRDFVDGDRVPLDENGHGTHIASTIAQRTDNALGETGLAFGAKILPLRVLDSQRNGRASDIAKAIRLAARRGAQVINLSLDFGPAITGCAQVPTVCGAIRAATKRGALVVAAAGNDSAAAPDMPAAAPHVLSVSASTDTGCLASYSNSAGGHNWSITAPGGGGCTSAQSGSPIWQYSLKPAAAAAGDYKKFGFVGLAGTSQAAAETSAAAALVIARGGGSNPSPAQVSRRLRECAHPAGAAFGAGLLDAARATAAASCGS